MAQERDVAGRFVPGMVPWNKKEHIKKVCPTCGTEFSVKPSLDRVRYCSCSCARRGTPSSLRGRKASEVTRARQRAAKLGNGGPDHWNYKGTSTERHMLMGRDEYIKWRNAVFERDDYICQQCGQRGVYLQAHHIQAWSENEAARYELENGVTLCVGCHSELHGHYIHPFPSVADDGRWSRLATI